MRRSSGMAGQRNETDKLAALAVAKLKAMERTRRGPQGWEMTSMDDARRDALLELSYL